MPFIIDCPYCKAKVAARDTGRADRTYLDEEMGTQILEVLLVGQCPSCQTILAGFAQRTFTDNDSDDSADSGYRAEWIRVYPKPTKAFSSLKIPRSVTNSLAQADKCLQADAPDAACVMFGRALEVVCRDQLLSAEEKSKEKQLAEGSRRKQILLADGIRQLRAKNIIEERLFDWSQQLRAFRNVAAHAINDESVSREDAEDLQAFVYAIIEYIYDLTERYQEFTERQQTRKSKGTAR